MDNKKLVSRREFLIGSSAIIAATTLAACTPKSTTETVTSTKTVTTTSTPTAVTLPPVTVTATVTPAAVTLPSVTVTATPSQPTTTEAAGKFTKLTFTSGFSLDDRLGNVFRKWFSKLQFDSGGRIQVADLNTFAFPVNMMTGALGGFANLNELRDNVDWVWAITDVFSGNYPLWLSMGSFVYGTDIMGSVKACTQAFNEFPEMQAEFANRNMKLLGTFAAWGNSIQTVDKPVRTLSDLNGLRISGGGQLLKQYGAIVDNLPSSGPGAEYTTLAANKDQLDGVLTLPEFLASEGVSVKGGEIIKYSTYLHIPYGTTDIFVLKMDKWNSIPQDIQKIMEDSLPWFYDTITQAQISVTQDAMDEAKARGTEFIELPQADLDKINSFCEQSATQVAQGLDAKGLPGTKIFQRIRQLIAQYESSK